MMISHGLERGLGAEMMRNQDLVRDPVAVMILSQRENLNITIYAPTQTLMNQRRMKDLRGRERIRRLHRLDLNQRLCPISCANSQNLRSL